MSMDYAAPLPRGKRLVRPQRTGSGCLPLSMAGAGSTVRIQSIRGGDDVRRFLHGLGFVEEAEATVVSELGGNVIVQVKGTRVAVSRAMAGRILTIPQGGKRN